MPPFVWSVLNRNAFDTHAGFNSVAPAIARRKQEKGQFATALKRTRMHLVPDGMFTFTPAPVMNTGTSDALVKKSDICFADTADQTAALCGDRSRCRDRHERGAGEHNHRCKL